MDKSKSSSHLTQSKPATWFDSKWPETLIAQHSDLDFEIKSVNELLNKNRCSLIQLDVRLKKLTKAVLTHLELEAHFLTPLLAASKVSSMQKSHLNQSFDALFATCRATIEYIHSLKLAFGNGLVTVKQGARIVRFLDEIKKRLNKEDVIYSQMTKKEGVVSEI
ncbi:hypothetical protein [Psychromonas antarctica]|uniref:hypothetical protein n=1 Tax=Psychromonas antarctica TaxID=67573 RepID=UPI001EE86A69|nr:hypothetical protein [Psychromonas antarctica]MCG6202108.1 hypothetical protein [Psychromonas antarctica]